MIERPGRDDEARCVGAPLLVWVRGRTEMGRVEPRQFEPGRWWVEVPRDGLNTDVDTADEAIRLGREAIARAYEPEPTPAPVPHFAIVPGFWRVEGYDGLTEATRGGHVRVKAHTGEGLVVWGLSFWGETATWAYRTYGMALDEFLARYPASLWFPEVDATPATTPPDEPEPTRTLFSCRTCCAQSCGGWSDGAMDRPGWHDIERIDGPRSMCPGCWVIGDAMLDGLREEYPHASIGRERPHRPTSATEAPTAPSEPDEGAVSPAGPGEAVRPRVGAWVARGGRGHPNRHHVGSPYADGQGNDRATTLYPSTAGWCWYAWHDGPHRSPIGLGKCPTLDAAKAAADAALEAAGYVLEGGAHVDMADDEAARARAFVARARAFMAPELAAAQGARLTEARDARDEARALLDRIAKALGIPGDWRDLADDVLEVTAADWREQAKRHEDAATVARGEVAVLREALARLTEQAESAEDVARVLRCEPGDVAGAALAALEQAALARGEAAGLERALRVLAEVRRG